MPPHPWHLRPIGAFACLWALALAADYTLTQLRATAYLGLFTHDQIAYFTGMPAWIDGLWGLAAWPGLLGALLLLCRARGAALMLGVSALATAVFALWLLVLSSPPMQSVTGAVGAWAVLGGTLVQILLWVYARAEHSAGVLP